MTEKPAPAKEKLLEIEHLSMRFGGLVAVGDLSMVARRGEITAIIGPNGAGKTTLFNCVTGFYRPTTGRVTVHGADGRRHWLERMDGHSIAREARVARTFQNIRLFGGMSVLENLLVAQHAALMKASRFSIAGILGLGSFRRAEEEAVARARSWLEQVGLLERADELASGLPYGAQRRLEIARAMCSGPELLCLDEPAAGLNPAESAGLNALLRAIRDETGVSILLIEHDMSVVMRISDHVVVMDHGTKIAEGRPEAVRADPAVIRAYLGAEEDEPLPPAIRADLASRTGEG